MKVETEENPPFLLENSKDFHISSNKIENVVRPNVFLRNRKSGDYDLSRPVRFITNVFSKSGISRKSNRPLVSVEQLENGDVIVSSVGINLDDDQEIIASEHFTLPAGSFTMRNDFLGSLSRGYVMATKVLTTFSTGNLMRLASVVVPIIKFRKSEESYLLLTQRQKRKKGTYNDLWVFPGGHVDAGESLRQAAVRELVEEVGLRVEHDELQPLGCWQEFYHPKRLQYLVVIFYYELVVDETTEETQFLQDLGIQTHEVQKCVLLPENAWNSIAKAKSNLSKDVKFVRGIEIIENRVQLTDVDMDKLHGKGKYKGVGYMPRFAIECLLETDYK